MCSTVSKLALRWTDLLACQEGAIERWSEQEEEKKKEEEGGKVKRDVKAGGILLQ